jgi:hypothetical protein
VVLRHCVLVAEEAPSKRGDRLKSILKNPLSALSWQVGVEEVSINL